MAFPPAAPRDLSSSRVAVYASGGAPSHHLALLALWGAAPRIVHAEDILAGKLEGFDAVVFPGGGLNAMAGQLAPLGADGVHRVRDWVARGGTYLGSCAGSCHPLRMSDAYRDALPDAAAFQMCELTPVNAAAGAWGLDSPGTGRLRVQAEPHPLFDGLDGTLEVVHYNGPLFPPAPGTAGRVLGATEHFTPFERSAGLHDGPGTLERAVAAGARIAYRGAHGDGQVIVFGSHPEFGASALQLGWLPAARLLANAVALVPTRGTLDAAPGTVTAEALASARRDAAAAQAALETLRPLGERLPGDTPPFLGFNGRELWSAAIDEAADLLARLLPWLDAAPTGAPVEAAFLLDLEARANQDFGFAGARQLLRRARGMLERAATLPPERWPAFTGAYNEFNDHPYHLVASVYLSGTALVAAAALQATAFAAANGATDPSIVPVNA